MRGEKTLAIVVAVLILLYFLYRKMFSVSTSLAGVPVPDSAKTLTPEGAAAFGFTATPAGSAPVNIPLGTDAPNMPDPTSAAPGFATSAYPYQNTLDTAGLGADDLKTIQTASFPHS